MTQPCLSGGWFRAVQVRFSWSPVQNLDEIPKREDSGLVLSSPHETNEVDAFSIFDFRSVCGDRFISENAD